MTRSTNVLSRNHPRVFLIKKRRSTDATGGVLQKKFFVKISQDVQKTPVWLKNITKIPVAFKPEPYLDVTPTFYFKPRFTMFTINDYHRKSKRLQFLDLLFWWIILAYTLYHRGTITRMTCSGVFIVNFEHMLHLLLVFLIIKW